MHGLSIAIVALFCYPFVICVLADSQCNGINKKTAEKRLTKEVESLHPGTEYRELTEPSKVMSNIHFSYKKLCDDVYFWRLQCHEFEFEIIETFNYKSENSEFLFKYCSKQLPDSKTLLKLTLQGLTEKSVKHLYDIQGQILDKSNNIELQCTLHDVLPISTPSPTQLQLKCSN